jgi:PhoH-like ATPase
MVLETLILQNILLIDYLIIGVVMKDSCWGIFPKNEKQQEVFQHLLDPDIDLVILKGIAGSGKTLLALAAGLEQTFNKNQYNEIIFTRAAVAVGEDMGHLPGEIEDKMHPWCGALFDNMDLLLDKGKGSKLQKEGAAAIILSKIKICAMMHMRGRTLVNKWIIVDEVQNIPINELKVLITRVGEGSKLVLLGDETQIDNRRLGKESNGLTRVIEAFEHSQPDYIKCVDLPEGVRSRLCSWGSTCL